MKKNLKDKKSLNIAMLGHKRIPSREGGIEIVVEELATRMVTLGHKVTCYNRSGHHVSGKDFDGGKRKAYKGVRLKSVLTLDGKIANIKFVCGPLGGGESLPNGLKNYAKGHEIIEVVRSGINRWYRFKLRITGKLNRCDYIMFANKETQKFLVGGRELSCPYELVFDNGLRPDELVNWTEKEK